METKQIYVYGRRFPLRHTCCDSHLSMQSVWKACLQEGSARRQSPSPYSIRQILHWGSLSFAFEARLVPSALLSLWVASAPSHPLIENNDTTNATVGIHPARSWLKFQLGTCMLGLGPPLNPSCTYLMTHTTESRSYHDGMWKWACAWERREQHPEQQRAHRTNRTTHRSSYYPHSSTPGLPAGHQSRLRDVLCYMSHHRCHQGNLHGASSVCAQQQHPATISLILMSLP